MANNMLNINSNNNDKKSKKKLDASKQIVNPKRPKNLSNVKKDKEIHHSKRLKTLRIDQDSYNTLDTWRRIMSDKNTLPFQQVIKNMNDDLLLNMDKEKSDKFARLKRRVESDNQPKDSNDFSL